MEGAETDEIRAAGVWARVFDPAALAVVVVIPVFWAGRELGLIAPLPLWVLFGALVLTWLSSSLAFVVFPDATSGWRLVARVGIPLVGIGVIIYTIGWGPTLAIGLLFGAVDCIRLCGLRAVVPAIVWSVVVLALGELAIALDVSYSFVDEPYVHGLAFLAALGVAFTIILFARATKEKERAQDELGSRERRFRALVQHASDIILVIGPDGELRYVSPAFTEVLGHPVEEALGANGLAFTEPNDAEILRAAFRRGDRSHRAEVRMRHRDRRWLWFEVTVTNLFDDPSVGGWVANLRDVTQRRESETALREAQAAFKHAFEDAPIGMALIGLDGRIIRANRAIAQLFGRSPRDAVGLSVRDITHPDDRDDSGVQLRRLMDGDLDQYHLEKRYLRPDGEVVWAALSVSLVRDAAGEPAYAIGQLEDITDRRALSDRLAHEAAHDPMTGLPNRTRFMERLELARARHARAGSGLAVMFVDLDQFKMINDGLGHAAGDQVLATVADRLRGVVRPGDVVARFGGDEFTVLCDDVADADQALERAARLTSVIAEPIPLGTGEVFVTASVGISLAVGATAASPADLLRDADTAMYRAKEEGRAQTRVFRAVNGRDALTHLRTATELHRALERREFEVHYQPIVRLTTNELVGFEALLRWAHPERGLLAPGEFIGLAEDTGLIVSIGAWVLETACRQTQRWRTTAGLPAARDLSINVNLSPRQLADPALAANVAGILARTGIDGSAVCLELTENTLMHDTGRVIDAMAVVCAQGMRFSIDDFGTGYSSLAYLRRFPVASLKIDRTFVDGIGEDAGDTSIVHAVVDLAHTLGLEAIAEGVECDAQLHALRAIGCDFAQGYHLGRATPAHAIDLPRLLAPRAAVA